MKQATPVRRTALLPATLAFLASAGAALSCTGTPAPSAGSVTYQAAVRPILEAKCTSCHHAGGPAPFSMEYNETEWKDGAPSWVGSAVAAVEAGRMPPWLPSDDCRDLAYARVLTDTEKATLLSWRDADYPAGDPGAYKGPAQTDAPPALGEPDMAVAPMDAYTPSTEAPDDYRCFILPMEFPEETYLIASSVLPGEQAVVHHALLYMIPPSGITAVEKLDDAEDGPGYTCFGGPGGGALTTLGAWVPGSVTIRNPESSALVIPAGSKVVMQLHYNTLALNGAPPPADRSTAQLWTTKEKPKYRIESLPMAHLGMNIPAGEQASVQERVFEMPGDGTIVGLAPHMHLLGQKIEATIEPAGGEDACLIDIPRWDFHWQQMYPLSDGTRFEAKKGDKIRVKCTYDNSAANQPIINGTKKAPEDVAWGEGTLDEMCLLYVATMLPYDAPDIRCGAYPACVEKCAAGDSSCFFDCATVGGGQCAGCLIQSVAKCAPPYCASTGLALQQCSSGCQDDGPGCLTYTCKEQFDAFYACMEPHLENGDCADQLSGCGI